MSTETPSASLSSPSASDIAHEWFQKVWNEKDEATIDRLLNPQVQVDGLPFQDATKLHGPEEFKQFHRAILSAIPDIHITLSKVIEQGDWACVRFVCQGTHSGTGLGPMPTGKRIEFSGIGLMRIHNGQWVEGWNSVDFLGLSHQIGGALHIG